MFNIGDEVSVIHDVITGKVVAINGGKITIEDTMGFSRHYRVNELIHCSTDKYNLDTREAIGFIKDKIPVPSNQPTPVKKQKKEQVVSNTTNEIDLHIEVLMPEAVHWPVADILQRQMIACRAFVERAIAGRMNKIVLIHGKGEGGLKNEIYCYLNRIDMHLPVNISYHDADFRTFGTGATQVNFKHL